MIAVKGADTGVNFGGVNEWCRACGCTFSRHSRCEHWGYKYEDKLCCSYTCMRKLQKADTRERRAIVKEAEKLHREIRVKEKEEEARIQKEAREYQKKLVAMERAERMYLNPMPARRGSGEVVRMSETRKRRAGRPVDEAAKQERRRQWQAQVDQVRSDVESGMTMLEAVQRLQLSEGYRTAGDWLYKMKIYGFDVDDLREQNNREAAKKRADGHKAKLKARMLQEELDAMQAAMDKEQAKEEPKPEQKEPEEQKKEGKTMSKNLKRKQIWEGQNGTTFEKNEDVLIIKGDGANIDGHVIIANECVKMLVEDLNELMEELWPVGEMV